MAPLLGTALAANSGPVVAACEVSDAVGAGAAVAVDTKKIFKHPKRFIQHPKRFFKTPKRYFNAHKDFLTPKKLF